MSPALRLRTFLTGAACATALALPAAAQSVRVTAGEHGPFTRIVLQSVGPFDWSLSPEGRERQLRIDAAGLDIDLDWIFGRIPRTRLADMRQVAGGLELILDCDCEIRIDRPGRGVVTFDIFDGPALSERPAPRALPVIRTQPFATDRARGIGTDLARRLREELRAAEVELDDADPLPDRGPLMDHLTRQLSMAIAQGLVSATENDTPEVQPPADPPIVGADPSNMRITMATTPIATSLEPAVAPVNEGCPPVDLFAFATATNSTPFIDRHAALMRSLYGEFDHPNNDGHAGLAILYLQHGFGAEARVMIENAPAQVAGRDLLLGLGDTLEGRYSNARLRLAERIGCDGVTATFAAVAGAETAGVRRQAEPIARAYGDLSVPLRLILGEPLVRRLIEAEARDAARMVADALRRSADPTPPEMPLVDALIEAARGDIDRAVSRLESADRADGAALVMRLQLAIDRGERPGADLLSDAEALAATERATDTGIALMSLLARLHIVDDRPGKALELVDRLFRWLSPTPANAALVADLRDAGWAALATTADEAGFLRAVFERADWRGADLTEPTRLALAARMVDYGLTDPARVLAWQIEGPDAGRLRARILIATGDPAAALDELEGMEDQAAGVLRAQALRMLGRSSETADELALEQLSQDALAGALRTVDAGLMQRSVSLLSESAELRDALDAILGPTP